MTDQKVLFGLHIPKCAGTSILKAAQSSLPASQIYQATALVENFRQNRNEFYEITNHDEIRFFFGHHVYDEMIKLFDEVYLFTFLRDPVERHVSNFKFLNRLRSSLQLPPMSVEEYAGNDSSMCSFILNRFPGFVESDAGSVAEQVISVLKKFDYVGDMNSLSRFSGIMAQQLGQTMPGIEKENAAAPDEDPGDEVLESLVESLNISDDIELHDAFRSAGNRTDNPFRDESAIEWRRNVFSVGECDYEKIEDRLVNSLYWEYRDHGILDQFLELIPRKMSFLQKFIEKATLVPDVDVEPEQQSTEPEIDVDPGQEQDGGWMRRVKKASRRRFRS